MKVDRNKIIALADKYFLTLSESDIANILFEVNNYTLPKIAEWKKLSYLFDHLPPTVFPTFINLNSKDLKDLTTQPIVENNRDFFVNVEKEKAKFVVVAKIDKTLPSQHE